MSRQVSSAATKQCFRRAIGIALSIGAGIATPTFEIAEISSETVK